MAATTAKRPAAAAKRWRCGGGFDVDGCPHNLAALRHCGVAAVAAAILCGRSKKGNIPRQSMPMVAIVIIFILRVVKFFLVVHRDLRFGFQLFVIQ
ncbi:hypothetical protein AAVH_29016 [Aphelenchoides avenae]|nr:hypothetical protein AAVH_29016 [Aphelenchus avenae]